MRELIRTNDPIVLNLAESLLKESDITSIIFDQNMSIMEGSIGVLPKRLMVADDEYNEAKRILIDADLSQWVKAE